MRYSLESTQIARARARAHSIAHHLLIHACLRVLLPAHPLQVPQDSMAARRAWLASQARRGRGSRQGAGPWRCAGDGWCTAFNDHAYTRVVRCTSPFSSLLLLRSPPPTHTPTITHELSPSLTFVLPYTITMRMLRSLAITSRFHRYPSPDGAVQRCDVYEGVIRLATSYVPPPLSTGKDTVSSSVAICKRLSVRACKF